MDRDSLIDRLYAIACQYGDMPVTLDWDTFSIKDICLEAGKALEAVAEQS